MNTANGIISLSGGLDSTTLLYKYKEYIAQCVFFYYGSKQNARELEAVEAICKLANKPLEIIDATGIFRTFDSALLSHSTEEIEEGPYDKLEVSNAKVPFRNGIFTSVLVGLAESKGLSEVYLAVHAGDHRLYPDCTPKFFTSLNNAVNVYNNHISIKTPFIKLSKADIALLSQMLDVPVGLTFSCYKGGKLHCGKCPTCIERRKSLGLYDTTIYEGVSNG